MLHAPRSPRRLVAVTSCASPVEAHLARSRLEAEGIPAFVADEHIVSVSWLYSAAVGGVKVLVRATDLEFARELLTARPLRRSALYVTDDLHAPRCPRCGSLAVEKHFARRLTFASAVFLGFPLPLFGRRARCRTCSARWRPR
jgi:hypothetical protein